MGDDNEVRHEYERVVINGEGATARESRIYGSGGRPILEGWQVADDSGQTAWIKDAGAIAVFGQPLYPGETTEAGPLWRAVRAACTVTTPPGGGDQGATI
jgi:hypothetical protein